MSNPPIPIDALPYIPRGDGERPPDAPGWSGGHEQRRDSPGYPQYDQHVERPNGPHQGPIQGRPDRLPSTMPLEQQRDQLDDTHPPPPPHPSMPSYSLAGQHAASSYLDRVEHDPRVQDMLNGAPDRSFHDQPSHVSEYPRQSQPQPQEQQQQFHQPPGQTHFTEHAAPSSRNMTQQPLPPPGAGHQRFESVTSMDKPLPPPGGQAFHPHSTAHAPSQSNGHVGPATLHHRDPYPHHQSQGPRDILSPPRQTHPVRHDKSLSQVDRYPPFPVHRTESILDHAVPLWPNGPEDHFKQQQNQQQPLGGPRGGLASVDPVSMPLPQ